MRRTALLLASGALVVLLASGVAFAAVVNCVAGEPYLARKLIVGQPPPRRVAGRGCAWFATAPRSRPAGRVR